MQNKNRRRVEMKIFVFIATLIFSMTIVSANVVINEIMYNPSGSDTGREWIEVYNDESQEINLSGWKIYEAGTNHNLNLISGSWILNPGDYVIIADNDGNFLSENPDFSGTLFDSSFSLSNSNETIALKNNSLVNVESITYFSSWGGNGNNNSLQLVDGEWCEGTPTPGEENVCEKEIEECIENWTCSEWSECADEIQERECTDSNSCGTTASKPAIEEDCNETLPAEEKNCDNSTVLAVTLIPSSAMFGSKKEIELRFNSTCYNYDKIRFLVYGTGSRIISDAQGSKITKYSGCENGTELQVTGEETIYDMKIPFFIYPNCDKYYKDGSYSIALRACKPSWEKYSENIFSIEISGLNSSICTDEAREFVFEDNETATNAENESLSSEERLLNAPKLDENKRAETTATADVIYESKSEKIKNSAVYWLLGASVALSIYLILVKIK